MRRYLRFLRNDERELGSHDERLELAEVLSNAPGTSAVEIVGAHPRGGYGVQFDLAPEAIEAFFSYLGGINWRPVM